MMHIFTNLYSRLKGCLWILFKGVDILKFYAHIKFVNVYNWSTVILRYCLHDKYPHVNYNKLLI